MGIQAQLSYQGTNMPLRLAYALFTTHHLYDSVHRCPPLKGSSFYQPRSNLTAKIAECSEWEYLFLSLTRYFLPPMQSPCPYFVSLSRVPYTFMQVMTGLVSFKRLGIQFIKRVLLCKPAY